MYTVYKHDHACNEDWSAFAFAVILSLRKQHGEYAIGNNSTCGMHHVLLSPQKLN